ncbi:MAG: 3D-(3,5/4)-trihydroxycyclohexane-1,2-dione acylhydrolase (decyclizing) [Anaerolineae bacterium]|nr:3D-(3,5/4)-trihydroxycyclohexane-1,2-dione acylhydrolase (decyclizing) [Anaerolineae bacterium]
MKNGRKKTIRLTVGQAIVRYLQSQYSERDGAQRRLIPAMFGIFGHGNVAGLGQALEAIGSELPFYRPNNEQSMVHTAAGFAKASRRLATLACSSSIGPGATNMITGAATATINRLPVLLFPADYYATRYQGPVLQQLEHPIAADVSVNDCFRPVSRFFDRITRPEQLLTALPNAMRVLTNPAETGTVTIAIPQDIGSHAYDYPVHFLDRRVWRIERRIPDPQRLDEALALIRSAKRPMIIAGGGVYYAEAERELETFAETFGIPVSETSAGKGVMRNGSALLLGGQGANGTGIAGDISKKTDLVICIGTRLTDFSTGSHSAFQSPDVKFISVNVCDYDAYKHGALPIVADAKLTLQALIAQGKAAGLKPRAVYLREIAELKDAWDARLKEAYEYTSGQIMTQGQLIHTLNEQAKPGDVVVAAAGSPPGDLLKLWDVSGGRACHLEFGYSCMGYEIPAGLGVRMAQPTGEVYVYIGDGTYLMNPMELVTAAQNKLKITVVISENHGYQCIRGLQLGRAGHAFGNEFRIRTDETNRLDGDFLEIDFAGNAKSMGARVWNAKTPDELRKALAAARKETRTCVIVVETSLDVSLPGSGVWMDIEVAEVSEDSVTNGLRKQYEQDREDQRLYY